jgi:hypothetical protein
VGEWKDWIVFGIAVVGAALGILNYWNAVSQRRVRLKVRPVNAVPANGGPMMFAIEVLNLSTFPLTITELGCTLDGRWISSGPRSAMTPPILIDGGSWPRRLEPRTSVTGYCYREQFFTKAGMIGRAYARTDCGQVKYGTSAALNQLKSEIEVARG